MFDWVRNLWAAVAGKTSANESRPEVIVHDPEAKLPHDLDDPFFDRKVQSRMADVIAHSADKK
ncbi:MAG: hypothetical protein Q8M24_26600 [Pseudolabrys sp.]|nr:hypothetical protein [Pseudolabrys sp.]MDP2299025.1 hypothetical protein [Pseudolabrys sp.]